MKRFNAFEIFAVLHSPLSAVVIISSQPKMRFPCTPIDVTWDWWWGMPVCIVSLQWLLLFRAISYIRWLMGVKKRDDAHQNDAHTHTLNYESMCKRWRWKRRKMRNEHTNRNIVFAPRRDAWMDEILFSVCVVFVAIVLKCIRKVLNRITNISAKHKGIATQIITVPLWRINVRLMPIATPNKQTFLHQFLLLPPISFSFFLCIPCTICTVSIWFVRCGQFNILIRMQKEHTNKNV